MQYDLVFEGGGAKGMVLVGACEEFFSRGHTFDRLLGTSAGAITAALLAAGYTPAELRDALAEKDAEGKSVFAGFMGPPAPFTDDELQQSALLKLFKGINLTFVPDRLEDRLDAKLVKAIATNDQLRHIVALIERGGWFAADRFVFWLVDKLDSGQVNGAPRAFSRMTMSEFHRATGIELSLVASDTTDAKLLVLNHNTAPECPVVWAVRMSMSIPLLWDEVVWRSEWGGYLTQDITGHVIVDGGLLSNFPIELFISDEPHIVRLMGPKRRTEVLGMLIDERMPVSAAKLWGVRITVQPGELKTVQRLDRLVETATKAHDKMVIDEYQHLVVHLPAGGYGTTEFDMSDQRRATLVDAGRAAMALYFDAPAGLLLPMADETKAVGGVAMSKADRIALGIFSSAQV